MDGFDSNRAQREAVAGSAELLGLQRQHLKEQEFLAKLDAEDSAAHAIGTALGLVGGWILLRWTVDVLFPRVVPDIRLDAVLTTNSLALVIALGIVAVAVAPLFTIRKLRRMDIPSTLRVME